MNRNSGVYGINLFINARVDFESGEIGVEESENPKYEREREAVAAGILGFGGEGEYAPPTKNPSVVKPRGIFPQ